MRPDSVPEDRPTGGAVRPLVPTPSTPPCSGRSPAAICAHSKSLPELPPATDAGSIARPTRRRRACRPLRHVRGSPGHDSERPGERFPADVHRRAQPGPRRPVRFRDLRWTDVPPRCHIERRRRNGAQRAAHISGSTFSIDVPASLLPTEGFAPGSLPSISGRAMPRSPRATARSPTSHRTTPTSSSRRLRCPSRRPPCLLMAAGLAGLAAVVRRRKQA